MICELKWKDLFGYDCSILISKYNAILYNTRKELFQFYITIYENYCNVDGSMYIEQKQVNSKNYKFINIMDFNNIIEQLEFKKETLLYDYIEYIIETVEFIDTENIVKGLNNIEKILLDNIPVNINNNINFSIFKIISSTTKFKIDNKNQAFDLILFLLNKVIEQNKNKDYLIFYDSDMLDLKKIQYDNVCFFDTCNNLELSKYNIFVQNKREPSNFIYSNILEMIEKSWPVEYDFAELNTNLYIYLKLYINSNKIETNNTYILIISKIFQKTYKYFQKLEYDYTKLNLNVLSYLLN